MKVGFKEDANFNSIYKFINHMSKSNKPPADTLDSAIEIANFEATSGDCYLNVMQGLGGS